MPKWVQYLPLPDENRLISLYTEAIPPFNDAILLRLRRAILIATRLFSRETCAFSFSTFKTFFPPNRAVKLHFPWRGIEELHLVKYLKVSTKIVKGATKSGPFSTVAALSWFLNFSVTLRWCWNKKNKRTSDRDTWFSISGFTIYIKKKKKKKKT